MWQIEVRYDLVDRWFERDGGRFVAYMEVYYVVAVLRRRYHPAVNYVHYVTYEDDWEGANKLAERIRASANFSPEGKPAIWSIMSDVREQRPRRPFDWKRHLTYGYYMNRPKRYMVKPEHKFRIDYSRNPSYWNDKHEWFATKQQAEERQRQLRRDGYCCSTVWDQGDFDSVQPPGAQTYQEYVTEHGLDSPRSS